MIKKFKQWVKVQLCKHDWEDFGSGFGCTDGVVYNRVCLICEKKWLQADEMKRRSELLAEMFSDDRKAIADEKKRRKERMQELGYDEPQ